MKEIYIIRHGETDFNKQGIVQGRGVNSDLNEKTHCVYKTCIDCRVKKGDIGNRQNRWTMKTLNQQNQAVIHHF